MFIQLRIGITIPDKTLGNKEVGQICETCQEKSCLKIILLSENGYPYVGEKYTIKLGNTLIQEGSLDEKGRVSLKNIEAGNYIVEFPIFKPENFSLESGLDQSSEEQITCGTTLSERELRKFDKPILFTLPANNTYRVIAKPGRVGNVFWLPTIEDDQNVKDGGFTGVVVKNDKLA